MPSNKDHDTRAARQRALSLRPVSRETEHLLTVYERLLREWSKVKNLVAPSTMDDLWKRHFVDSLQLLDIASETLKNPVRWIDMGAGAGFPGIVIAIASLSNSEAEVILVESDHRKCAFLRAVSRETGVRTLVIHDRIENVAEDLPAVDCVTARALAPLDALIRYSEPMLGRGALGLFPKGQHLDDELTGLSTYSSLKLQFVTSLTDPRSRIVLARL